MSATPSPNTLHITIGVYPARDISLQQDIKLVKAALLYADKVTLYSPTTSILQIVMRLGDLSENEELRFMEMVVPYVASSSESYKINALLQKLHNPQFLQSKEGKTIKSILLSKLSNSWVEVREVIENMAKTAGIDEINTALNSGILDIHQFSTQKGNLDAMLFMADCIAKASGKQLSKYEEATIERRNAQMVMEFAEGVFDAVASGSTYPLFDMGTGELVNLAQKVGRVALTNSSQQRARHIAIAGDLFRRLPVFDIAHTKDVLLVRDELNKHLIRFRKSVIAFSSTVTSGPWDDDFYKQAELLFHKEIAPAILDLEDEIKSNRFLSKLARQAVDRPLILTPGATLSLILSRFPNLPAEIVGGLGISASAAALVYDAYIAWSNKKREIERNGLYFYYQAHRKFNEMS